MPHRYQIWCGSERLHIVSASDEGEAIFVWMDMMGYETLEEAAEENFCMAKQIEARRLST
jgi:hypothetical protein